MRGFEVTQHNNMDIQKLEERYRELEGRLSRYEYSNWTDKKEIEKEMEELLDDIKELHLKKRY